LKRLSDHLSASIETADAIGRSLIVQKDASFSLAAKQLPGNFIVGSRRVNVAASTWFVCDDKVVRISYDLIPENVSAYIRFKALTIAGVEDGRLLEEVKRQIQRAIAEGIDFKEFKSKVNTIFDTYGVTKVSHNHLQTVFRTNVFAAYSLGQLNQVKGMPDRFPMWRYMAIKDNRTRASHLELNEKLFKVGEGPIPPIDYGCRCTAQYVHVTEVVRGGLKAQGWTKNKKLEQLDMKKSFKAWASENQFIIPPGSKDWIQEQL
jgi:SPP1 gp7 family putative phage head morphogenesis protein